MTKKEFTAAMDELQAHKSRGDLSQEQLALRILGFWKEFKHRPAEDLDRGVSWYVRHGNSPFFPQLDELLEAISQAPRGTRHGGDCACGGDGWIQAVDKNGNEGVRRCRGPEEKRGTENAAV